MLEPFAAASPALPAAVGQEQVPVLAQELQQHLTTTASYKPVIKLSCKIEWIQLHNLTVNQIANLHIKSNLYYFIIQKVEISESSIVSFKSTKLAEGGLISTFFSNIDERDVAAEPII